MRAAIPSIPTTIPLMRATIPLIPTAIPSMSAPTAIPFPISSHQPFNDADAKAAKNPA
ncbi:hypothetical protein [Lentibacillus cibarius]|nr:hypothetical protein [Lentibacillus cibarius]